MTVEYAFSTDQVSSEVISAPFSDAVELGLGDLLHFGNWSLPRVSPVRSSGRVEMEIDSELVESSFLKLGDILIAGLVLERGGSKER